MTETRMPPFGIYCCPSRRAPSSFEATHRCIYRQWWSCCQCSPTSSNSTNTLPPIETNSYHIPCPSMSIILTTTMHYYDTCQLNQKAIILLLSILLLPQKNINGSLMLLPIIQRIQTTENISRIYMWHGIHRHGTIFLKWRGLQLRNIWVVLVLFFTFKSNFNIFPLPS